jgi:Ca2+-binding EF-hand superfamily protein
MDINKDGSITANELQQTLRLAQSSEFSIKTVELLMSKYDTNGDREISFEEFYDLFSNLNEEFESFLLMDSDGSGSIDLEEFANALKQKGYNFSRSFFQGIMEEIDKKTGHNGIRFDNYIRVAARFDFLCQSYRKTPYFQKESLEVYLKKTFFQDFW